jgi:hypothetical protein
MNALTQPGYNFNTIDQLILTVVYAHDATERWETLASFDGQTRQRGYIDISASCGTRGWGANENFHVRIRTC